MATINRVPVFQETVPAGVLTSSPVLTSTSAPVLASRQVFQAPVVYDAAKPIIKVNNVYCKVINIYADIGLNDENVALEDILVPDRNFTFLRDILRESEIEINSDIQAAAAFSATW